MDMQIAAQNLKRIQQSIDIRLHDARIDRKLLEKRYEIQGRYLEHLSSTQLTARYGILLRQLAYLLDDFRDIPPAKCGFISSWWWIGRLIDFQTEFRLRSEQVPPLPNDLAYIAAPSPLVTPQTGERGFIVRYSEMKFMQDLMSKGTIRLNPASAFNEGSLDAARRDEETRKSTFRDGRKMIVTSGEGDRIPVLGEMAFSTTMPNYYLSCWATEHDPRLFREFPSNDGKPANACINVWEVGEFARRLGRAAGMSDAQFHHMPVEYFDPYRLEPGQKVSAGISKEIFYAYQREYRFIWLMNQQKPLQPWFIHAGPMEDIATLLAADGSHIAGRPLP